MEEVLYEYEGTLILVTHDRRFLSKVATSLLIFDKLELRRFEGGYNEYLKSLDNGKTTRTKDKKRKERLMVIENNINRIIGMISTEKDKDKITELDKQLKELLIEKNNR